MPKTRGNKARVHRSVLLAASLGSACTTVPGPERTHEIRAHWLESCAPDGEPGATELDLEALGDFPPSADTEEALRDGTGRLPLLVPGATRSITVRATTPLAEYLGTGSTGVDGSIDVLLWPTGAACSLHTAAADGYPGPLGGQAMGVSRDGRLLLIAGGDGGNRVATAALTIDLGTGAASPVASSGGLGARRAFATATSFGEGLLVAGGTDPEGPAALGSAEVFDGASLRFEPEPIALEAPRSHHAAVVLSSGETLLVGGVDESGQPLKTLVAISPETRRYRISGLTDLATARVGPTALALSDGRVLVTGGTDASGSPISSIEWLESNASRSTLDASPAGEKVVGTAYAAMPGGGALAVGGCDLGASADAGSCATPCLSGSGCASRAVYWLTPEGGVERLPDVPVELAVPVLVAGEEGRPWLADGSGRTPSFLVFDPWKGQFEVTAASSSTATAGARHLAADAGSFVWLAANADTRVVSGLRHGTRGPYVQSVTPLLLTGTDGTSLDRPARADPAPDETGAVAARDPSTGDVALGGPTTLVVTDATYADFAMTVDVRGAAAPLVRLADAELGGPSCPWPRAPAPPFAAKLVRAGARVSLSIGTATHDCPSPPGRLTVSLRAPAGVVTLHSIEVLRR